MATVPLNCLLIGKISEVDYRNKGHYKVYTPKSQRTYKLFCPRTIFCPLQEGDAIQAWVKQENDGSLTILKAPFVEIATDKDSIIHSFIKMFRESRFGSVKANQLYDIVVQKANGEHSVIAYLSELASNYIKHGDPDLLNLFQPGINPETTKRLYHWWHKNHTLRRLYLFGLNNHEIEGCKMSYEEIYQLCLTNPYRLPAISLEKCDEILFRQDKKINPEERRCGEILRRIWFYQETRAWNGVPSNIMTRQFPDYTKYREKLENEYRIKGELFTIYLHYPWLVESELARWLYELNQIPPNTKYGDPHFLRSDLTPDQKEAIAGALLHPLSLITGYPGSGKSTIIAEIVHNLELQEIPYAVVSFTGKAVARLKEILPAEKVPHTMHRMIARARILAPFKHLIIDEASMVSNSLIYEFIKAFPLPYSITLVGDCNQLEPIEWGSFFSQCLKTPFIPRYHLTHIHRVNKEAEGIILNSRKIIEFTPGEGEYDPETEETYNTHSFEFEESSSFIIRNGNKETIYDIIISLYKEGVKANQITVITPYNRDIDEINMIFQEIYHNNKPFIVDHKNKVWKEGDRVMMLENRYDINVMNGEEGLVVEVKPEKVVVEFRSGERYAFQTKYPDEMEREDSKDSFTVAQLIHSYCITVHRSQGSEWDYIIFYMPPVKTENSFLSKNMIYTAITRAQKAVWCIGDITALLRAVQRAPAYRCDNLSLRMNKYKEKNNKDR